MKLILAIIQKDDAGMLVDALTKREYRATRINTAGGFLKESNATILVGVSDDQVDDVLSVIKANCQVRTKQVNPLPPIMEPGECYEPYPVDIEVGGATVIVLDVLEYKRL